MSTDFETRASLRTVSGSGLPSLYRLRLTLVFHPTTTRIGAFVDLQAWHEGGRLRLSDVVVIGRNSPCLSDALPISEPHVSRAAVRIESRSSGDTIGSLSLRLSAVDGADTRIGRDGAAELIVDGAALVRGVPLRMGHGVVALLRLVGPGPDVPPSQFAPALLGASYEMNTLRALLATVAGSELPVLIVGESGVGKERVAHAIHAGSPRQARSLVTVNMAAIPESLAASELFGAEKGAYTGAHARQGHFQRAHGGTLFLDEVADTPSAVQPLLLRALEQGDVQVVGGREQRVDVRVIAATDGSTRREDGFRHALLTRLAGYTVAIPPLRARLEDLGPQAAALLSAPEAQRSPYPFLGCATDDTSAAYWGRFFHEALCEDWLGNTREWQHAVQRALAAQDTPPNQWARLKQTIDGRSSIDDDALEQIHRDNAYSVRGTAQALGWSHQATYRRIDAHPRLRLAHQISEGEIAQALHVHGDVTRTAYALGVSVHALRPRLKSLPLGDS